VVAEHRHDVVDLVGRDDVARQRVVHLVVGEEALLAAALHERLDLGALGDVAVAEVLAVVARVVVSVVGRVDLDGLFVAVGLGRGLELIVTGRTVDAREALAIGLVNEVAADPVARALALADGLAAFPQETLNSDRRAALEGFGLPLADGLALEARIGRDRVVAALSGAARFAAGEGRGGAGAGA
jgi:hypothetical protein